jgi:hypothetical protein
MSVNVNLCAAILCKWRVNSVEVTLYEVMAKDLVTLEPNRTFVYYSYLQTLRYPATTNTRLGIEEVFCCIAGKVWVFEVHKKDSRET